MAYITHIHIENCRNVQQLDVDLSASAPEGEAPASSERARPAFRHLILTGPNGSGKSGVLKAIARCMTESLLNPALDQAGADSIESSQELFDAESLEDVCLHWSVPGPTKRRLIAEGLGHIIGPLWELFTTADFIAAYLPPRRLLRQERVPGPSQMLLEAADLSPAREFAPRFLQFLVNRHTEMAYAQADGDTLAADRLKSWFERLWNHIRILMEDPNLKIRYDRRAFNFVFTGSDGYEYDLSRLADGHAAVLALLAEILIRIDAVQQARGDFSFEPEGVVVVDEIETHLHLSLQEQILPLLTDMFPRLQFIVATHSPAVIASIPGAVVYDLRKKAQARSDDYRGIPYGVLMTEHFGISSDIDLDSTRKLLRFRELAAESSRTPEEEREMSELAAELSSRSQVLATEVWMVQERLRASNVQLAGE